MREGGKEGWMMAQHEGVSELKVPSSLHFNFFTYLLTFIGLHYFILLGTLYNAFFLLCHCFLLLIYFIIYLIS